MLYEVIDNFLSQKEFEEIKLEIMNENMAQWVYTPNVTGMDSEEDNLKKWKYFYMSHAIYSGGIITSPHYDHLIPIFEQLDIKALIRIKANMYPSTENLLEHAPHQDFSFNNKSALYYVNTNDGYTQIGDIKVDSIKNRIVVFDGSREHYSTNCTNTQVRVSVNFNFL